MTNTAKKFRGLFLAALMVLSVIGGSIMFAGAAAAQSNDTITTDSDEYDEKADSTERFWSGQTLLVNDDDNQDTTLELYSVRQTDGGDYRVDSYVSDVQLNGSGEELVNTENLDDGRYVIVDPSTNDVATVSNGNITSYDSDTSANIQSASWTVATQNLNAQWDETSVRTESNEAADRQANLEVTSNRGNYNVLVGASGLGESDLKDIFGDNTPTVQIQGQQYAYLSASTNTEIAADFQGIDPGEYQFNVIVVDTGVAAQSTLDVQALNIDYTLQPDIMQQQRGDIVEFSIELQDTDEAHVTIGGPSVNYLTQVHVVDDDSDGYVNFTMNTVPAGVVDEGNISAVFDAEDDRIENIRRPRPGDFNDTSSPVYINNTIEEGQSDDQLLDPAEYPVFVSTNENVEESGGDLVVPEEVTTGVIILEEGSTDAMTAKVIPRGDSADDVEDIQENAVDRDVLARGDLLVLELNASGIGGYISDAQDFVTDNNALAFSFARGDEVNRNTDALSNASLVADRASDTYYLVIRSSDLNRVNYPNDDYSAAFGTLPPIRTPDEVDDEGVIQVSDSITLEDPSATVDGVSDQNELLVSPNENVTVSGTTNIAPGSEVRIRLAGEDDFLRQEVTVGENGTWEATFDLSEVETGTSWELTFRRSGRVLTSANVMVTEPSELEIESFDAPSAVTVGNAISLSATVTNTGGQAVSETVEWSVAGEVVRTQDISLEPGESVTVDFAISSEGISPGDYTHTLTVGDVQQSADITIEPEETATPTPDTDTPTPDTDTPTPDTPTPDTDSPTPDTDSPTPDTETPTDSGDTPGFGLVVALIALIAAALLAIRRE